MEFQDESISFFEPEHKEYSRRKKFMILYNDVFISIQKGRNVERKGGRVGFNNYLKAFHVDVSRIISLPRDTWHPPAPPRMAPEEQRLLACISSAPSRSTCI